MVTGCNGWTNVRVSTHPCCHNGHGRSILSWPCRSNVLQHSNSIRSIDLLLRTCRVDWSLHDVPSRHSSSCFQRTEETLGILDYFTDWVHDTRNRSRRTSVCVCDGTFRRHFSSHNTCNFQGSVILSSWSHHT